MPTYFPPTLYMPVYLSILLHALTHAQNVHALSTSSVKPALIIRRILAPRYYTLYLHGMGLRHRDSCVFCLLSLDVLFIIVLVRNMLTTHIAEMKQI
jgi:succinate-acetate transporter protein